MFASHILTHFRLFCCTYLLTCGGRPRWVASGTGQPRLLIMLNWGRRLWCMFDFCCICDLGCIYYILMWY